MGMGMMGFGFLVFAGLLGVVVWAIAKFAASNRMQAPVDRLSARRILDERYARGEINQEEYQRIRRELG